MLSPRSYTPPPRTQTLPRSRAARELYFSANSDILIVNRRENTRRNTSWSVSVFQAWWKFRQERSSQPLPALAAPFTDELDSMLASFIVEARRQDGKDYPPNTLHNLMCGLQRHPRDFSGDMSINLVDFRVPTPSFRRCRNALDARMKQLSR